MKYFSIFSGIGGFEIGIQKAYAKKYSSESSIEQCSKQSEPYCIGFSEVNKYAIQIYNKHFSHQNWGDATRIIPEDLPSFDFLCGGFPCQAFSIAGKRGGFKDTRGTLFFEIARVISVKRPKLLLLENVKGLLSHDRGRTFGTILSTLSELGYICQWQVLNSKDFGVPQNRERVFIVGHLGNGSFRKIFPIGESSQWNNENGKQGSLRKEDIAACLQARDYKDGTNFIRESQKLSDAQRIRDIDGLSVTLKSTGGGGGAKTGLYVVPVLTPNREEKRQNGRRMKTDGEPSFTLTSQDQHGIYDGERIRRLTPTECERLQGFPDGWTKDLSDSQRYKCLGNAVTVNVIEAIMEEIL